MVSDFAKQIEGLWLSVFFGIFLAVVYDILRIVREMTSAKKSIVFIMDFLYLSFCGVITFMAAFATNYGVLRFYHIGGELLGAFVYFLTFGRATFFITKKLIAILRKIRARISSWLKNSVFKSIKKRKKGDFVEKKQKKAKKG